MIIKFFDRTETVVNDAEAKRITSAINRGVAMIQVKGMMINPKSIAMIKPGGHSEADIVPTSHRLARPDHRGETSQALERLRAKWGKHVPPSEQETA